jgi:hypothetical protein
VTPFCGRPSPQAADPGAQSADVIVTDVTTPNKPYCSHPQSGNPSLRRAPIAMPSRARKFLITMSSWAGNPSLAKDSQRRIYAFSLMISARRSLTSRTLHNTCYRTLNARRVAHVSPVSKRGVPQFGCPIPSRFLRKMRILRSAGILPAVWRASRPPIKAT